MDWLGTLSWTILGAFIGAILGFLATKYFAWVDYLLTKLCSLNKDKIKDWWSQARKVSIQNPLLVENSNNVYNSFTSFDKSYKSFANIISDYLEYFGIEKVINQQSKNDSKRNSLVITNIQEPEWYWNAFERTYSSGTQIGILLEDLKNQCEKKDKNFEKISNILNDISSQYYADTSHNLFPHQKTFKTWNRPKKIHRLNIFKMLTDSTNTGVFHPNNNSAKQYNESWLKRNPLHKVLLFVKIFSKGVLNWVTNPYELSRHKDHVEDIADYFKRGFITEDFGTDAIIIHNEEIFNYDMEIGAINCYRIHPVKQNALKSFFSRVEKKDFENDAEICKLRELLKNYDLSEDQINDILNE